MDQDLRETRTIREYFTEKIINLSQPKVSAEFLETLTKIKEKASHLHKLPDFWNQVEMFVQEAQQQISNSPIRVQTWSIQRAVHEAAGGRGESCDASNLKSQRCLKASALIQV